MPQERKTRVPVYVDRAELEQVRVNAARAGLSMSEWGRKRLLEEPMSEEQGTYNTGQEKGGRDTLRLQAFALAMTGEDRVRAARLLAQAAADLLKAEQP